MGRINLHTDGGCRGNGSYDSVGAWAYKLVYGEHVKKNTGAEFGTTNNQMELKACIEGLKAINDKTHDVHVHSDSAYLVNCITQGWYKKWRFNGWMTSRGTKVENVALWQDLLFEISKFSGKVIFVKVAGHKEDNNIEVDRDLNIAMDTLIACHR